MNHVQIDCRQNLFSSGIVISFERNPTRSRFLYKTNELLNSNLADANPSSRALNSLKISLKMPYSISRSLQPSSSQPLGRCRELVGVCFSLPVATIAGKIHAANLAYRPFSANRRTQRNVCYNSRVKIRAMAADESLGADGSPSKVPSHGRTRALTAFLSSPWDSEIFSLSVPALLSLLLDPFMGMVDTAIVGRLGTAPLAAVGISSVVYNFSNFIWNFLMYTTTPRIASAAARGSKSDASRITSQGMWVAATIGVLMSLTLWFRAAPIFVAMGGSPDIIGHAVPYIRGRCIASPAILMFYVAAGTFRGFKDTTTPLLAGIVSNIVHLGLDIAFVFWLQLGATGAALATSLSHWLTLCILLSMVMRKGYLRMEDLLRPPKWVDVAPTLRNGLLLSTRSLSAMSVVLFATQLVASFGPVASAAHEILRQIWVFSNQAFTSLDIATQSLVAYCLGRDDRASAAAVFKRTIVLAIGVAFLLTIALMIGRTALPSIFTKDAAVIGQVSIVMPLIAMLMPVDATSSVMDGVLLGSQEAAWLSRTMFLTSLVAALGLMICKSFNLGLLAIWASIKMLSVGRLIGNSWRLWSRQSPLGNHLRSDAQDAAIVAE